MEKTERKARNKEIIRKIVRVREVGALIPLLVGIVIFSATSEVFLTASNFVNILQTASYSFIMAIGMTFMITIGATDLSVGAVYAMGAVVAGRCMVDLGIHFIPAFFAAVLVGVLCGLINGVIILKLKLPPFIGTMAGMNIYRGLIQAVQKGDPVFPLPENYKDFCTGTIQLTKTIGIPYVVIIAVIFGVIATFLLNRTVYGRSISAVGGNCETARLAGIPVLNIQFSAYVLSGMFAAIAGYMMAGRAGTAQPSMGTGMEFNIILGTVVGGTSLAGGAGTIPGTALGVFFMTMISTGMTMAKVSPYLQQFVLGLVLVFACSMDLVRQTLKK